MQRLAYLMELNLNAFGKESADRINCEKNLQTLMDLFYKPHRLILQKLIDSDVEFIVVGGYAVNFHGFNRPTGDIDLWQKPSAENQ